MTRAVKAIVGLLVFEMFVRSVDYLTGDSHPNSFWEDGLQMPAVWGSTCLAATLLILFGLARNKPGVVQTGSIVSFAIYVMFAIQVFEMRMLPYPWPPEDTRIVATHLMVAGCWLTVAVTIWWREYINLRKTEELEGKVRGE